MEEKVRRERKKQANKNNNLSGAILKQRCIDIHQDESMTRWKGHKMTWNLSTWGANDISQCLSSELSGSCDSRWPRLMVVLVPQQGSGVSFLCHVRWKALCLVFSLQVIHPVPLLQTGTDWDLRQSLSLLGLSLLPFPPPHASSLFVKKLVLGEGCVRTYYITLFCIRVASGYLLKSWIMIPIPSPLTPVQLKWNKAL